MKHRFLVVIETPMNITVTAKMISLDIGCMLGSLPVEEQEDVEVTEVRYIGNVNHAKGAN